eukprot:COSAG05_NODE_1132_length_5773_cov_7.187346_1_plen_835_part_10
MVASGTMKVAAGQKGALRAAQSSLNQKSREWLNHSDVLVGGSRHTGPTGGHALVGTAKIYVDGAQRLEPSRGGRFTVCAFLGSSAGHTAVAHDHDQGCPQWAESVSLAVEEVTDTIQLIIYRGEIRGVPDRSRLRLDKCVGQVLIPLAHHVPGGGVQGSGIHTHRIKSKSVDLTNYDCVASEDSAASTGHGSGTAGAGAAGTASIDGGSAASVQFVDGATAIRVRRTSLDDLNKPSSSSRSSGSNGSRSRMGRTRRAHRVRALAGDDEDGVEMTDRGIESGGLSSSELEKYKHVMGTSEYKREKRRTKEKRTGSLAANKSDDLFREIIGGRGHASAATASGDADEDRMTVRSAPDDFRRAGGGDGGSGMSVRSGGSSLATEEQSEDSQPISEPSNGGGSGGGGSGRHVHFAGSSEEATSEAAYSMSSAASSSVDGENATPPAPSDDEEEQQKEDGGNNNLPEVPLSVSEPGSKGEGVWYEIFPFCEANNDGLFRTAVDELEGLAMTKPKPRTDLPELGCPQTLGYIRIKVELHLIMSPYSCYIRQPKLEEEEEELSIVRLKANWRRVKRVLMPNHFIYQAKYVASWENKQISAVALAVWAYLSLMAPFWQYPMFTTASLWVVGYTNRGDDRLLERVIAWEDYADPDPDPFTLRKLNKIKNILRTIQRLLGKFASFCERLHYMFSWYDPIVTTVAYSAVVACVLLAAIVMRVLYSISMMVGGRPILFAVGCIMLLPPRVSVLPWNKVDKWRDRLEKMGEAEATILAMSPSTNASTTDGPAAEPGPEPESGLSQDLELKQEGSETGGVESSEQSSQPQPEPALEEVHVEKAGTSSS